MSETPTTPDAVADPEDASVPDEPAAVEPAAVEPAAVEPAAVEPAGAEAPGQAGAVEPAEQEELPGDLALRLADPADLVAALEAILFVTESPMTVATLASGLQLTTAAVEEALATLRESYDRRNAGIDLREVAGGVRIYTRPAHAEVVEHFLKDGQRSRLSQAALETLAVIAYRQPVTRARVSAIRGVNVDGVVRTLLARGLVVEVGTEPETGGGLFRTTDLFLERMGLTSLDELPSLAPMLPDIEGIDDLESVEG